MRTDIQLKKKKALLIHALSLLLYTLCSGCFVSDKTLDPIENIRIIKDTKEDTSECTVVPADGNSQVIVEVNLTKDNTQQTVHLSAEKGFSTETLSSQNAAQEVTKQTKFGQSKVEFILKSSLSFGNVRLAIWVAGEEQKKHYKSLCFVPVDNPIKITISQGGKALSPESDKADQPIYKLTQPSSLSVSISLPTITLQEAATVTLITDKGSIAGGTAPPAAKQSRNILPGKEQSVNFQLSTSRGQSLLTVVVNSYSKDFIVTVPTIQPKDIEIKAINQTLKQKEWQEFEVTLPTSYTSPTEITLTTTDGVIFGGKSKADIVQSKHTSSENDRQKARFYIKVEPPTPAASKTVLITATVDSVSTVKSFQFTP